MGQIECYIPYAGVIIFDLALLSPTLLATYHIGHFSNICLATNQLGSIVTLAP